MNTYLYFETKINYYTRRNFDGMLQKIEDYYYYFLLTRLINIFYQLAEHCNGLKYVPTVLFLVKIHESSKLSQIVKKIA